MQNLLFLFRGVSSLHWTLVSERFETVMPIPKQFRTRLATSSVVDNSDMEKVYWTLPPSMHLHSLGRCTYSDEIRKRWSIIDTSSPKQRPKWYIQRQNCTNHRCLLHLVLEKSQASLHHNILQNRSRWDVNGLTFSGHNDDGPLQSDSAAQVDLSGNRKVV